MAALRSRLEKCGPQGLEESLLFILTLHNPF
jgi:hypothetical protein